MLSSILDLSLGIRQRAQDTLGELKLFAFKNVRNENSYAFHMRLFSSLFGVIASSAIRSSDSEHLMGSRSRRSLALNLPIGFKSAAVVVFASGSRSKFIEHF